MRLAILLSIVGIAAMHHETILSEVERLTTSENTPEVVAALELRCGDALGLERRHCEADLRDAFASGSSDAGEIVRLHCTRFENGWSAATATSPTCASMQDG